MSNEIKSMKETMNNKERILDLVRDTVDGKGSVSMGKHYKGDGILYDTLDISLNDTRDLGYYCISLAPEGEDFHGDVNAFAADLAQGIVFGKDNHFRNFDYGVLRDDYIKNHVKIKLINSDDKSGFLETVPYIPYLDLAAFFYVSIDDETSYMITHEALSHLKFNVEDLWVFARKNMAGDFEQISNYSANDNLNEVVTILSMCGCTLYSNKARYYGGSVLCFPEVFSDIAVKVGGRILILPSSVHEVIVMPYYSFTDLSAVREMVRDINQNEVEKKDILSNNVYLYNANTNEILIAV